MSNLTRRDVLKLGVVGAAAGVAGAIVWFTDTTGEKGSGLGKEFTYDLEELRKVDPKLITYEEVDKAIETGFKKPRGISVGAGDRIYVVGDKGLRVLERDGRRVSDVSLADKPRCVAVADDGVIYVGMKDHVEVLDPSGEARASWEGLGPKAVITSIAVSGDDVFVGDAGNRIILRYDRNGRVLGRIGRKNAARNVPGLIIPGPHLDVAVGPDGLLRASNVGRHRIEAYTFDGDLEFWWGEFSNTNIERFCGCCNPIGFAILPDGGFVTAEKGLTRVKVYDAAGKFEGVVAPPKDFPEHSGACSLTEPRACITKGLDVAVDSGGRILVVDPIMGNVRSFVKIKTI